MMKTRLTRWIAILLAILLMPMLACSASAMTLTQSPWNTGEETDESAATVTEFGIEEGSLSLNCKSAVLMEATTGTVLYTQNPDEALPPASVTKIMTLLLVMEAIDSGTVRLDNTVTVSANAASMGGSQVYLKEGERMSVEDLLKSVVIASANDAAVALAEYLAGSVNAFVEKMNTKAERLGMKSTRFENVTGLDDTAENHLTSARDIALMSQALVSHRDILQYSSIWMDSIRNGEFGLTNTNRLVRFYQGCTGLKTGSTSKAGFCVSATAERDGLSLICVIMGAESRDIRNAAATELLDWGFANYELYKREGGSLDPIPVTGGNLDFCTVSYPEFVKVLPKGSGKSLTTEVTLPNTLSAPVKNGEELGMLTLLADGKTVGEILICASCDVEKISFFEIFTRMLAKFLLI